MPHIPGPWWVDITRVYGGHDYCGKPCLVAEVNGLPNVDDNSRLIAAAPDLLAALHGVLHWAECECKTIARDTPPNDEPPMCDYCVAKAAIEKAERKNWWA